MKLPIGIQDFEKIRQEGMLYVDKTENIHRIVTSGDYYFLSRPRRFGKSLLLSTMRALYEGRKSLFDGLWIENYWDWSKQFPVIHIQFAKYKYQHNNLEQAIENGVLLEAQRLGIQLTGQLYKSHFEELIISAAKESPSQKVVILIDEYDKPIIDYLDNLEQAAENRQILKNFYSVLKDSDPYIELVFITGVSRFSKTSIFSDLNNLINLTMHPLAAELLGITEKELEANLGHANKEIALALKMTETALKLQIQYWYNGYSWDGKAKVYNPFSLLNFYLARQFDNFWFETGTPTFLVKKMRETRYYNLERIRVSDAVLDSYDLENLNPVTILFQTGYLTIQKRHRQGIYLVDYPNQEVKISMEERLLNSFSYDHFETGKVKALALAEALEEGNIQQFISIINATFSTIPAELWQKENEAFYHALVHLLCSLMGAYIQSEVNSAQGRLDARIETADTIYILEFKLDKSAEEAITQIEEKNYFHPYLDSTKKRVGIGINFSKTRKEVDSWLVKAF